MWFYMQTARKDILRCKDHYVCRFGQPIQSSEFPIKIQTLSIIFLQNNQLRSYNKTINDIEEVYMRIYFCGVVINVLSSSAIVLLRKRES